MCLLYTMSNLYDKQGIRFLANRNNRSLGESGKNHDEDNIPSILNSDSKKGKIIEGFNNESVNEINKQEYNELLQIETEFQRELQNYNSLKKNMMENAQGYLETSRGSNPNRGQNVKIGNKIGYVTNAGLFKEYQNNSIADNTSGKNGCPANWESAPRIDNHFPNDFANQLYESIPGSRPLINGLPMKNGQACGNEGSNVFVSEMAPTTSTYIGIYNSSGNMNLQEDLGQTSLDNCKYRAALKNNDYFAMSNFDGTNGSCYIGNFNSSVMNSGTAIKQTTVKDFRIKKPNQDKPASLLMGYDGRLHAYNDNSIYWSSSNEPTSGCDPIGGGNLYVGPGSGASATYGQNCSNWGVKPNLAATGLGGEDPLPGSLTHIQKKGNKTVE